MTITNPIKKLGKCCAVAIAASLLAVTAVTAATMIYVFSIGVPVIPH